MATPVSVPGYLLYTEKDIALDLKAYVQHLGRYAMSHSTDNNDMSTVLGKLKYSYARSEVNAIVNLEQVSTIKDSKLIPGNKYGYLDLAVFTA
jgi:hypothetical protein